MEAKKVVELFNKVGGHCFISDSELEKKSFFNDVENIINVLNEFKKNPNLENEESLLSNIFKFAANEAFQQGYDACTKDFDLENRDFDDM